MAKLKEEVLKDVNFQVPMDIFKRELLKKENGEQEYQKLVDSVFPILMEGIEQLSKEVEVLIESKEEIDMEVRQRFNPCLFLGYDAFLTSQGSTSCVTIPNTRDDYYQNIKIYMIRRLFWNMKKSFLGTQFLLLAPKEFFIYPLGVGLPIYMFSVLQSGNTYYDEYDGDVSEVAQKN